MKMKINTYHYLEKVVQEKSTGFILLIDPDKLPYEKIEDTVGYAKESGVDLLFIGSTLLLNHNFNDFAYAIKKAADSMPVIIFPGSIFQVSPHADAILYLSVISGRNPTYLIDNQVIAAPMVWKSKIEAISCAYMLIESGQITSAEFMSNSRPIPRNKPDLALAHALAAQYLGFKLAYLEGGSGAQLTVPVEMITTISHVIDIPLIVGGGIKKPQQAEKVAKAGASFIVIGNHFENPNNLSMLKEFSDAIHNK